MKKLNALYFIVIFLLVHCGLSPSGSQEGVLSDPDNLFSQVPKETPIALLQDHWDLYGKITSTNCDWLFGLNEFYIDTATVSAETCQLSSNEEEDVEDDPSDGEEEPEIVFEYLAQCSAGGNVIALFTETVSTNLTNECVVTSRDFNLITLDNGFMRGDFYGEINTSKKCPENTVRKYNECHYEGTITGTNGAIAGP